MKFNSMARFAGTRESHLATFFEALMRHALVTVLLGIALGVAGCASQVTRELAPAPGAALPAEAIASLEPLALGGVPQWVLLRGHDRRKPILLKIHGGPGQAEMATVQFNRDLERDFLVVEWDQRGAGKSASAIEPTEQMHLDRIADDTLELSRWLLQRFGQSRLILVGHSWGAAVALVAAQREPALFRALVLTGPLIAYDEATCRGYARLVEDGSPQLNDAQLAALRRIGPPPWLGPDGQTRRQAYVDALERSGGMWHAAHAFDRVGWMLAAPEYSWMEKLRYTAAAQASFERLLPQMLHLDLRNRFTRLPIPVVIAMGRHDRMADAELAQQFLQRLDAPHKQWVWFERSAHFPQWEEADAFHALLRQVEHDARALE